MSISIGIYDFFSYLIPGVLYLYIINEFLRLVKWEFLDYAKFSQSGDGVIGLFSIVVIGVLSYIAGHIVSSVRSFLLDKILYSEIPELALTKIKRRLVHSGTKMEYHSDEWSIFQEVLQVRNPGIINEKERLKANALMMRGFSFAAVLYAILCFISFLLRSYQTPYLIVCVISIGVAVITHKRSIKFDEWSYRTTFSQALAYGSNLEMFLNNHVPAWNPGNKTTTKTKRKPKKVSAKR